MVSVMVSCQWSVVMVSRHGQSSWSVVMVSCQLFMVSSCL